MEVETENKAWDPRWFVVRATCLCIHESDTHTEPTAVFPCAVRHVYRSELRALQAEEMVYTCPRVLQACTIVEPKSKRAGKPHAFRIEVQAYAVGSSARVEGTASKTVNGVKFIVRPSAVHKRYPASHVEINADFHKSQVHAESADRKEEWLKCLSDGGAFVPTIKMLTKLGGAKKQLNRIGIHRLKKSQDHELETEVDVVMGAAEGEEEEEDSD